jgi:catechol 2,3-dioxygenase-like lactoylglutathione lyase family enzyme
VVQVPVADVDRAKRFYVDAGFVCDHDARISDEVRVVQLTPPGSACSIVVGTGMISMAPGSLEGLQLVTHDMEEARAALLRGGVEVSEPVALGREGGPSFLHASFSDPDGNRWVLQELPR